MRRFLRALAVVGTLAGSISISPAQTKVESTVAAPVASVGDGARYFFSPRECHLAAVTGDGPRFVVIYDGVKGPAFDNILEATGLKYDELDKAILPLGDSNNQPVIFSPDGKHWAYAGRQGGEFAVFLDGKEIARINNDQHTLRGLYFAPGGEHLYWNLGSRNAGAGGNFERNFVVDGKAGPSCAVEPYVRFSRDGAHHAYVAARMENREKKFLVIDGKEASYFGENPVFTGEGKLVTLLYAPSEGKTTLQIDGKPQFTAVSISQVYAAPKTGHVAAIVAKPSAQTSVLYLDRKEVPGSEGVTDVSFSPDGKRYAAKGETRNFTKYFVIDGKRTPEYQIGDSMWSPDSSQFMFVASGGAKQFLIVNDTQSEGFQAIYKPTFSPDSKRSAFTAMQEPGKMVAVVGDAMIGPVREISGLMFSPDGSRYAFLANDPAQNIAGLQIDGDPAPQAYGGAIAPSSGTAQLDAPRVVFSRDGKHYAHMGVPPGNPSGRCLVIDGKLVPTAAPQVSRGVFTPDGNHFIWVTWKNPRYTVWVDGKEVTGWDHVPDVYSFIDPVEGNWFMGDDGALTFVGAEGKEIKRFRVTPDPAVNLTTMFADIDAANAKALADADAAKAQAAADAQGAKEKAAADVAKAKADAEVAAAAKAKARADAAAAKAKAREDAAAAARAKRGQ